VPKVTIAQAKANLSELIRRAERGEDVFITRGNKSVAQIVPLTAIPKQGRLDILRGKFKVTRKFFDSLPVEEIEAWSR
jgi:prevent-host-death family protein